jgi:hypothetical protein
MTKKLPDDDVTYGPDSTPDPNADKPKKEKSKYTEDPNDPAYVEPRLRPDWTPDQPG